MSQDQSELYGLLEKIHQGEQDALGVFYDMTVGRAFAVAVRVTSSRELAEEVVNDVYMQVWRDAARYSSQRATPLGWLLMMTRSRAIDAMRREGVSVHKQVPWPDAAEQLVDTVAPEPLENTLGVEQGHLLAEALQHLDGQQRQLIALAFYRGMSHQEIAQYTGEPLGTIKSILRRAQTILRAALKKSDLVEVKYYEQA